MRSRSRCSADAGGVLPLVLVMLSLAALMTSAGLERSTDRSLLASAATERDRLRETAAAALAAGVRDAGSRDCTNDFSADGNGRYTEARARRWGKDYPWAEAADVDVGEERATAGFIIERLAHDEGRGRCRLLVTAGVRTAGGDRLFGQALLSPSRAAPDAVRVFVPVR